MTVREQISEELGALTESELRQVAHYVAFLRFRARVWRNVLPDPSQWTALYGEAAGEDRDLAEAGMAEYAQSLAEEDIE